MKVETSGRTRRTMAPWSACAFGLLVALLSGCGGGSGGGTSTPAPQGNLAFRAAAIALDQALNSGLSYPMAMLKATGPTGSPITRAAATLRSGAIFAQLTPRSTVTRAGGTRAGVFALNALLNLYAFPPVITGNTSITTFYSDAAGTQLVGSITLVKQGVANFADAFARYPATATGTFNLTAGNAPCRGNITIVYSDATGANTMTGHLDLTRTGIGMDLNLTLSDPLNVAGTVGLRENGQTITVTNITGPLLSTLSCQVKVDPQGWAGTGSFSLADGTFAMAVNPGTGTDTAQTDDASNLALTYADGRREVVNTPLFAGLLGSIGSNPFSVSFKALVPVGTITGLNTSGQMVGEQGYYASPTATPQPLQALPSGKASPTGINASGQIIGFNSVPSGDPVAEAPLFWPTPTSPPIVLKALSAEAVTRAFTINARGQMVGMSQSVVNGYRTVTPLYWADAASNPQKLPMNAFSYIPDDPLGGQYEPATSFFIADDGTMLILTGQSSLSDSVIFKAPATPSDPIQGPTRLAILPGQYGGQGSAMSANGMIAGNSGGATAVTWANASAAPLALPVPIPFGSPYRSLTSINSSGTIIGYDENRSRQFARYVWQDRKPININTLLPAGTDITITGVLLINDTNMVVAIGLKPGSASQYFVLIPR